MADEQKPQVIARWWNGHWGGMAKRDIKLTRETDGTLLLRWWGRDVDQQRTFPADQQAEATTWVLGLIDRDGGGGWIDLTAVSQ
jgi:hypothetical protein